MTMPQAARETDQKSFSADEALCELRQAASVVEQAAEQLEGVRKRLPLYASLLGENAPKRQTLKPTMAELVKRAHQELGR